MKKLAATAIISGVAFATMALSVGAQSPSPSASPSVSPSPVATASPTTLGASTPDGAPSTGFGR